MKHRNLTDANETLLCQLEGHDVYQNNTNGCIHFIADADVDADGANGQSVDEHGKPIFAYAPGDTGLDFLANAGYPNRGYQNVLVCDHAGKPVISRGGYISSTAWFDKRLPISDPNHFLDSWAIPFFVVEGFIRRRAKGVVLGCRGRLSLLDAEGNVIRSVEAMCGDIGPLNKIGEMSIAAARALEIDTNPRGGGCTDFVIKYEMWPDQPFEFEGRTFALIPA